MYYEVFDLIGDYYAQNGQWKLAQTEYRRALALIIPRWNEKENIIKKLVNCKDHK
jgi:hypothetical protein